MAAQGLTVAAVVVVDPLAAAVFSGRILAQGRVWEVAGVPKLMLVPVVLVVATQEVWVLAATLALIWILGPGVAATTEVEVVVNRVPVTLSKAGEADRTSVPVPSLRTDETLSWEMVTWPSPLQRVPITRTRG